MCIRDRDAYGQICNSDQLYGRESPGTCHRMDEKRVHSTIRGPDYRSRSKQGSLSQQRSGCHRLDQKQDRNISEEPWFERHCDCRALRLRRQPEWKRGPGERHPRSKRASEILVSRMHSPGLVGERSLERHQSRLTEDRWLSHCPPAIFCSAEPDDVPPMVPLPADPKGSPI